jgi:tetratricopeptide (TPR) repeat protein
MARQLLKILFVILTSFLIYSCTKQVPKDMQTNRQMPDDSIHKNIMPKTQQNSSSESNTESDTKGDAKAEQLSKEADDADAQYQKTKSDNDKKAAVEKQMAAANYLMFEANLSPKKKYRPALKRYRRVLELDPNNAEAQKNKQQLEDIYKSMGMPVPE